MILVMRVFLMATLAAGLIATAACNDKNNQAEEEKPQPTAEKADQALLAKMEAEIDQSIGEATCGEAGDCRAVPFGAKPCGGPWKFKVISGSADEDAKLLALIADYNLKNAELNEKHGWMSDCLAVMPPEIECVDGRCVALDPMKVKPIE